MSDHPLRGLSAECATKLSESPALADTVHDIVPMMSKLVDAADQYFLPEHYRSDPNQSADRHDSIKLERGNLVLLSPGSVSAFVPNPDHIHKTGCAEDRPCCVSLHLYGWAMNSFIPATFKPDLENSLTSHTKKRGSGNVIEAIRKSFA